MTHWILHQSFGCLSSIHSQSEEPSTSPTHIPDAGLESKAACIASETRPKKVFMMHTYHEAEARRFQLDHFPFQRPDPPICIESWLQASFPLRFDWPQKSSETCGPESLPILFLLDIVMHSTRCHAGGGRYLVPETDKSLLECSGCQLASIGTAS